MKEATKFNVAAATKPGSLAGAIAQTILKGKPSAFRVLELGQSIRPIRRWPLQVVCWHPRELSWLQKSPFRI